MIRKIGLCILLLGILAAFSSAAFEVEALRNNYSWDYYVSKGYEDTGSKNLVTGIYLDYRLFDSIFEASILLISVTGIMFITKKDD